MKEISFKQKRNRSSRRKRSEKNDFEENDFVEEEDSVLRVKALQKRIKKSFGINVNSLSDTNTKPDCSIYQKQEPDDSNLSHELPTTKIQFTKETNEIDVNAHMLYYVEKKLEKERMKERKAEGDKTINNEQLATLEAHADKPSFRLNNIAKDAASLGAIAEVDVQGESTNPQKRKPIRRVRARGRKVEPEKLSSKKTSEDLKREKFIESLLQVQVDDNHAEKTYHRFWTHSS
ncbi:hypothetical protein SJAG_05211 [Schizosaccharomyces japonicus yFS275]|uniref:Uncharacterized protein n=1 Tax=Schizosaccharomyces japonicus (strain yFS275 / FY16936) TaxID=402676 RepID=B6JX77_SCHJY|nr:hypothetical protein SJAG_05211 [Schizosaccharomyces japonicus yFS275]EEB05978.1 hypothetical protein SJAG_05211 [Schizosaccharomyces japonicus yFS275]